jgi:NitT/TauT family transport system substrate-binding protein
VDSKQITELKVGYSLSVNHAPAIVGFSKGTFKDALPSIEVKVTIFKAGTSAVEALFSDRIDIAYVGPTPAINGYVKSNGEALRIIAGASSGGAVFVVRNDVNINSVSDLQGKRFASPTLGNTQDVALRTYITRNGYELAEKGGTVRVMPVPNSDMITLFHKKEIDGAWVPEPWGARLVKETGARIFVDERDLWPKGEFASAVVIVRAAFLREHPAIVQKWLQAHVQTVLWINENNGEAIKIINDEFKRVAGLALNEEILSDGFSRLKITYDPIKSSLLKAADDAYELGFLGEKKPDLSNIYDLTLLNKVLLEKRLAQVED